MVLDAGGKMGRADSLDLYTPTLQCHSVIQAAQQQNSKIESNHHFPAPECSRCNPQRYETQGQHGGKRNFSPETSYLIFW